MCFFRNNEYRSLGGRGKNNTLIAGERESENFLYYLRHLSQIQHLAWILTIVAFTTVNI